MIGVIIIDDEEWVRFLIKGLVPWDKLGMKVLGEATDGLEGVSLCLKLKPDIVLVDIRMPIMDGLTVLEKLSHDLPDTKIIIISGYNEFEYAQKALKSRAFDYILKPVDEDELISTLGKARDEIIRKKCERGHTLKLKKELKVLQEDPSEAVGCICPVSGISNNAIIQKTLQYIHQNFNNELKLSEIAGKLFINECYLSDLFKREMGKGFTEYLTAFRMEKALLLMDRIELRFNEIADMVGYKDSNYFAKVFKKYSGQTPSEYSESRYKSTRNIL